MGIVKFKIKKKDKVLVISGRDRGKRGEVLAVMPAKERALVSKINMVTKHARPTQTEPGGIQKREAPLPLAKLMLVCSKCEQPMRPRMDRLATGERVRICRKCSEAIL